MDNTFRLSMDNKNDHTSLSLSTNQLILNRPRNFQSSSARATKSKTIENLCFGTHLPGLAYKGLPGGTRYRYSILATGNTTLLGLGCATKKKENKAHATASTTAIEPSVYLGVNKPLCPYKGRTVSFTSCKHVGALCTDFTASSTSVLTAPTFTFVPCFDVEP
jgi:hypothetical protein